VVVAVVENRWPDLPGNLPGFRAWLPPSETKEMSIINHIALLPISEDTLLDKQCIHSIQSSHFRIIEIVSKMIKQEAYITTPILIVLHITHPKDPYTGHLGYNKWHEI
jgi:hypothetical protein